jgi:hypothetical protein
MTPPAAPRSAHQLLIFVVQTPLASHPPVLRAIRMVVETIWKPPASAHSEFGWVLFDRVAQAVRPGTPGPPGAALATYADRALKQTDPAAQNGAAVLDAGLAAAYQLAADFIADRQDGLPVTVDLLAVTGVGCDRAAPALDEIASDRRIQLTLASYGEEAKANGNDGVHLGLGGPAYAGTGRLPDHRACMDPGTDLDRTGLAEPSGEAGLVAAWEAGLAWMAGRRQPPTELG